MSDWSEWRSFPDPRVGGYLVAPLGLGVHELRNARTNELVYIGSGKNCAYWMSSLLPAPLGAGTRDNASLRSHVLGNVGGLEYRTRAFVESAEAAAFERAHRTKERYIFST